jgi:nicotinamide-nucleotide amidase
MFAVSFSYLYNQLYSLDWRNMKAEIISTGTEIILGNITDTNTSFLAEHLAQLGIDLYYASSVGDNYDRMLGVLQCAFGRSDLIITTGGLGPTQGDITREVIAALLGEKMEIDAGLKVNLEKFFVGRGIPMSDNNLKQASLIPSAQSIPNPNGTAPGWWAEKNGKIVIAMPGPPGEMQPMWHNHVAPALQRRSGAIIVSRTLKSYGVPEGTMDEQLSTLLKSPNPTLALYAKIDGINLRITAKADTHAEAQSLINRHEGEVRKILGESVWGTDDESLEGVVGQALIKKGMTLAVAESFSSGSLMQVLGRSPESPRFFKGGFFTNSDDAKLSLGLVWGAGGAGEMAKGLAALARDKMSASIGIGIEGQIQTVEKEKTAKVYIAIAGPKTMPPVLRNYSGRLMLVPGRIAYTALFELRRMLEGMG